MIKHKRYILLCFLCFFLFGFVLTVVKAQRMSVIQQQIYAKKGIIIDLNKKDVVSEKEITMFLPNENTSTSTISRIDGVFELKKKINNKSTFKIKNNIKKKNKYIICTSSGYFYKPKNSTKYIKNTLMDRPVLFPNFSESTKKLIADTLIKYSKYPKHGFITMKKPPVKKIIFEEEDISDLDKNILSETIKINFTVGNSELDFPQKQAITNQLKKIVASRIDISDITVDAYSDKLNNDENSLNVAQKRANTIYNYLLRKGISDYLISVSPVALLNKSVSAETKSTVYIYLYTH